MAAPFSRRTLLGAAAAVVVIAACGSDDSSANVDTEVATQIATPDKPVTLPIYDDNPAIADGLSPESGTLNIANYADFVSPELVDAFKEKYGVDVSISTYENGPELLSRISSGALKVDLILSIGIDQLPKYVGAKLIQPLNKTYLTNVGNLLPSAANPFFDQGLHYGIPYTVFTTGIGFRTDAIDPATMDQQGWDALWDPKWKGEVGILNDSRDAFAMAMLKLGKTNINTPSDDDLASAAAELQRLVDDSNVKVDIVAYEKLPAGEAKINQAWSGDMVLATGYLPDGVEPSVLGYWRPAKDVTVVGTDLERDPEGRGASGARAPLPRHADGHRQRAHELRVHRLPGRGAGDGGRQGARRRDHPREPHEHVGDRRGLRPGHLHPRPAA